MDKILEVNNLKISFRTPGGTLKAVRDISFDLNRGETLAIVGESGSGKSVTSKAILGILSGNSIVEGGEIIFDAKDLLKIPEEEMHKIRADKIAMIFQDPLSSLNPIVKIGRQITEAMLLKNKAARKEAKREFNSLLAILKQSMTDALCALPETASEAERAEKEQLASEIAELVETFDKFNIEAIRYETAYNDAHNSAQELIADIDDLLFLIEKKQKFSMKEKLGRICDLLSRVSNIFLTAGYDEELLSLRASVDAAKKSFGETAGTDAIVRVLGDIRVFMEKLLQQARPNFFRIGYYSLKNPEADLAAYGIERLNEMALTYLDDNFMRRFISLETAGVAHSCAKSIEAKRNALAALPAYRDFFAGDFDQKSAAKQVKEASALVRACIDPLEVVKDSATYTFPSALANAVARYFAAVVKNPKEERRFARQSAKREAMIAKGKRVDWKVIPKVVYDLDELRANILVQIDKLIAKYEGDLAAADTIDMNHRAILLIDYLKEKASQVVYKITKRMAKERAIKLMDEVGIPESRIRYNQYPFEFSGGMRQRIVIAIALSSDPDILICDEPTTALDVTIQSQILELINNLKRERNLSVIFITHDLGVVANMADKIAVMYAGKIVEYGLADEIFYDPRHPYTWALLSSMPDLDTNEKLEAIPGTPPNMIYPPEGDAFADRNKYALKIDYEMQPPCFDITPTHWAATWLLHPNAPAVEPPHIIVDRIERMKKKQEEGGES